MVTRRTFRRGIEYTERYQTNDGGLLDTILDVALAVGASLLVVWLMWMRP